MDCCKSFSVDEKPRLKHCWGILSTSEFSLLLLKHSFIFSSLSFSSSPSILSFFVHTFSPLSSQAAFRTDLSVLLDQVGAGKESLSFMKRRIRRLTPQWATAANRLDIRLEDRWRDQKKVRRRVLRVRQDSTVKMLLVCFFSE